MVVHVTNYSCDHDKLLMRTPNTALVFYEISIEKAGVLDQSICIGFEYFSYHIITYEISHFKITALVRQVSV